MHPVMKIPVSAVLSQKMTLTGNTDVAVRHQAVAALPLAGFFSEENNGIPAESQFRHLKVTLRFLQVLRSGCDRAFQKISR